MSVGMTPHLLARPELREWEGDGDFAKTRDLRATGLPHLICDV
jgi:hypothetical protein